MLIMKVTRPPIERDTFIQQSRSGNHCPATFSNNKELDFSRSAYLGCSIIEFGTIKGATVPAPVWGIMVCDQYSSENNSHMYERKYVGPVRKLLPFGEQSERKVNEVASN
jgi:hypothetical protein